MKTWDFLVRKMFEEPQGSFFDEEEHEKPHS
jgi:hypothetical protein